jgi:hypothetical protein
MSILIIVASVLDSVLLIKNLNVAMSAVEVAGEIQSVAAHRESPAFFLFFVRFIVTHKFAVCDFLSFGMLLSSTKKHVFVPVMLQTPWKRRPASLLKPLFHRG